MDKTAFTVTSKASGATITESYLRGPGPLLLVGNIHSDKLGLTIRYQCNDPAEGWRMSVDQYTFTSADPKLKKYQQLLDTAREHAESALSTMLQFRKNPEMIIDVFHDYAFESIASPRADLLRMICCRPLSMPAPRVETLLKVLAESRAFGDLTRLSEICALNKDETRILIDLIKDMQLREATFYPEDEMAYIADVFRILTEKAESA